MKLLNLAKKIIHEANAIILIGFLFAKGTFAGYDLESATGDYGGVFENLVEFAQGVVDFIQGPFAVFFIIIGIITAGCLWIFAPDNRHLNKAFKAIAVGFVLFDIAVVMNVLIEE